MEYKFGFIVHPLSLNDAYRSLRFMKGWPPALAHRVLRWLPPFKISEIVGIESAHGRANGYFVSTNLTSRQILKLPQRYVLRKIIKSGQLAERLGVRLIGLGAMTAVVGDGGVTVARHLKTAVTTGNSYTVATALEATGKAAELMGIDLEQAEVMILGATGSIGSACAQLLARDGVNYLTLVARDQRRLENLALKIMHDTGVSCKVTGKVKAAARRARVIVAVSSSAETLLEPEDLQPGAVVCDVARPRDISSRVGCRDDLLVIEGGVIEVPGDVNFNFNFGFPPRLAYACMAEAMILTLENRFENFSLGRELRLDKVMEIRRLARKHGFRLAGFRNNEKFVTGEQIARIKKNVSNRLNLRCSPVAGNPSDQS
ncbi:MAG: shikimate dehydrogenase [Firmicutes bacterium]|nr:shikimate dehydrogenase [Bacillota bacterium]